MKNHPIYQKNKHYIEWLINHVPLNFTPTSLWLDQLQERLDRSAQFKPLERIEGIVIHHGEIDPGNAEYYRWFHRGYNGWDDIGYHFVIGNGIDQLSGDGALELGRAMIYQGAHVRSANHNTIGICLVGNLDWHPASEKQMKTLTQLVQQLMRWFRLLPHQITGHREHAGVTKSCPGRCFDLDHFRSIL